MRWRWVQALVGTFLLLFATGHGSLENTDATMTMHAARALWLRGDSGLRSTGRDPEWPGEEFIANLVIGAAAEGTALYGKQGSNGLVYVWFPMGHIWLMVPAVAFGELLDRCFPGAETLFRETVAPGLDGAALFQSPSYRDGHYVLDQALVAVLPAGFGAVSILLLFLIALGLGAKRRDALLSTAAIALGTQFFPLVRENLSDGPGQCFLLAALLATVRAVVGQGTPRTLLLGGCAAGCAVLSRYQHGTLVPFLIVAIALAAHRHGRLRQVLWFALGGLPCLALLLLVNYLRYGDVADTGYPEAGSWFNYPILFGATKILFAAGKGILWFSPLLWLVVPLSLRRSRAANPDLVDHDHGHGTRPPLRLRWLAWCLFLVPMLMFSSTPGWQAGQCWGVRYVTPGITCLLAIMLPQLRPWTSHRRTFLLLLLAGALVNLTGIVTPTRGFGQLAGQAAVAFYQREFEAGRISQVDWDNLDAADHYFFEPRYSALHANWSYLFRSLTGGFEDEEQRPRNGSANTIEPLFGVRAVTARQAWAPLHWQDRGGRHLWWTFWGALLGVPSGLLLVPVLLLGIGLAGVGWRRILQQP
ncbi:MAG: glycosyltransferase family 39 protein [Planctomycetes bacterium]|nr:glycosyltransferase family 39 protein [Planctomycetota bacterium]